MSMFLSTSFTGRRPARWPVPFGRSPRRIGAVLIESGLAAFCGALLVGAGLYGSGLLTPAAVAILPIMACFGGAAANLGVLIVCVQALRR